MNSFFSESMQWQICCSVLLSTGLILGTGLSVPVSTPAQSSDPYRVDWKPVAKVNPRKPVQVRFLNQTGETAEYTLVGHTRGRRIAPGQTAFLAQVPLPAYLEINPIRDRVYLRYGVSVTGNVVEVRILPAKFDGNRAFEIDKTGAIFAY